MSELLSQIRELNQKITAAMATVNILALAKKLEILSKQMEASDFWSDQEQATKVSSQAANLRQKIDRWENIYKEILDLEELAELFEKSPEEKLEKELQDKLGELNKSFSAMELELLFSGKYDENNALVSIHAGTGGTDAQDWAQMLERMFLRYAEKHGFKATILNQIFGNEAGIKSVDFSVEGELAYGRLKSEAGVHRLVRISPFDAEKMRHTSFALVEVLPEIIDDSEVTIKPDDLRIDVYRSGGKGGQSVNTTDSAVRITHLPTGIVVTCQNERSQKQNKERAMRYLLSKLQQFYAVEKEEERNRLRGKFSAAVWGNQARSYVLQPYKMVKDHRTEHETSDVDSVLDGELDEFILAYLQNAAQLRNLKA